MNRKAVFAGSFYPADSDELTKLLESYKDYKYYEYKSKAIIAPHAGFSYSGHAAMSAYQQLELSENVFIIAPSHHENFNGIALPKYTYFDTPLGSVEVNNRLIKEIHEKFPSIISDIPFEHEHAVEVQIPFLQNILHPASSHNPIDAGEFVKRIKNQRKKIKIIPIITGRCDYRLIADIIAEYWENSSFVISSDLSHYYSYNECKQIDAYTATIIETGKIDCFNVQQACGLIGIKGLSEFANRNSYSMIRVEMYNSGDIGGDKEKVVGYGSWMLYEGKKDDFVQNFYKDYILKLAKTAIYSEFTGENFLPKHIPPVLLEYGASFVTLEIDNHLRGCIGSIYPTKPFIVDLTDNAKNAAFFDPRFNPLTEEEFNKIQVSVSVLSAIERINFKDERDLLSKIYPYGIIIAERDKRAVYLPVVWEQLPEKEIFLNSLKEKAGLPPNYFSRSLEAYKFTAMYLKEEV